MRAGCTRQDMEFALQMFENAVTLDPDFALAWAAIANVCAHAQYWSGSGSEPYMERAQSASLRAVALAPDIPEVLVSQGWILYAGGRYDDAVRLDARRDRAQAGTARGRTTSCCARSSPPAIHEELALSPRRRSRRRAPTTTSTSRS